MTRPLFTGSSAERALACPASEALARVEEESGAPALRGSAGHAFLATARTIGREDALAATPPEWRPLCEAIDLDALPQTDPAGYVAEVAFAFNVVTGDARELGRNLSRDQAVALYAQLGPDEVPCTVDAVGLTADGEGVSVLDWKFGHLRVTPAERNAQLLLGAVCAARTYKRERASVAIVYMHEDRDPFFDSATLEMWDLDGGAARLAAGAAAVRYARQLVDAGHELDVFEGPWCRYCKAWKACRAKTGLMREIAAAPVTLRENLIGALHPATAAEVYRKWQVMKNAIDRVGNELYAYAGATPGGIDLGDGVVFAPKKHTVRKLDGAVVHKVMTDLHGRDIADRAVTLDATFEGIKTALRKVAQDTGAKLTHLESAVVAKVDEERGLEKVVSAPVKEFRPKKEKGEAA